MARLGVNVDHVATLREARKGTQPDPVVAAILVEIGGADGLVVHLREDRRHIQERDLRLLREVVKTQLNMEMAATQEMAMVALSVKPDLVTLVPERRQELTTEGGMNLMLGQEDVKKVIDFLHDGEIRVALFIDPDPHQIKLAHKLGADIVEIHTGRYANSRGKDRYVELHHVTEAARLAFRLGMQVSAGHGLDYINVAPVAKIQEIEELNIGHSIMARAILTGMQQAVREMALLVH